MRKMIVMLMIMMDRKVVGVVVVVGLVRVVLGEIQMINHTDPTSRDDQLPLHHPAPIVLKVATLVVRTITTEVMIQMVCQMYSRVMIQMGSIMLLVDVPSLLLLLKDHVVVDLVLAVDQDIQIKARTVMKKKDHTIRRIHVPNKMIIPTNKVLKVKVRRMDHTIHETHVLLVVVVNHVAHRVQDTPEVVIMNKHSTLGRRRKDPTSLARHIPPPNPVRKHPTHYQKLKLVITNVPCGGITSPDV